MNINYIDFSNTTKFHSGKVPYISFNSFDKLNFIKHGFSTKLGGVSTGEYESMNLTYTRNDNPDNVSENFKIIANTLGMSCDSMVYASQTHTTNILKVTKEHMGMGVTCERNYCDIDGLVTDIPGITLVTSYADCVPLLFADPVKKVIAASHSGWRGTVGNIGKETVDIMVADYGCKLENIYAYIGPSICKNCYEVGEDVAEQFANAYGKYAFDGILRPIEPFEGKFRLDLHQANYMNLRNAGLLDEKIEITDICTCCNPDILFSHRYTKGKRGGLCAFIQIRV